MTPKKTTPIKIIKVKNWSNNLVYLRTSRPECFIFNAGQFARIAAKTLNGIKNENLVWRAQSLTSSPNDKFLEFLILLGKSGEFSKNVNELRSRDILFLDNKNYGFLTLDRFRDVQDLWLFATGSGIAPYLSIIKNFPGLKNISRVNLIHSLRDSQNLNRYTEFLNKEIIFKSVEIKRKLTYLPILTQEITPLNGLVNGESIKYKSTKKRFTLMLSNGELEKLANCNLLPKKSKVMICGNPNMIRDTRNILKNMGFIANRRDNDGEIAVENYW